MICPVVLLLSVMLASLATSSVIPQPEHKLRVMEKPLSDEEHFSNEVHNKEFDHEAFLGKDEAKTFDQLTPEESKDRLSILFEKIDKDRDSLLTEDELTDWIQYVQARYIRTDTDRLWTNFQLGDNVSISWDTYKERTYGHLADKKLSEGDISKNYHEMMRRDFRRWGRADQNGDGALTKEEFTDFLHPEESKHMRDIIVDETIEDLDKNNDGVLSLEEYITDLWPRGSDNEEEPEWLKTEKEQFSAYRDQDKDGFMNRNEVRDWIIPPDYDHTRAEAKHLVYNADANKDERLSKEEVLEKYDLFVGSQATDFGEALRRHDEF